MISVTIGKEGGEQPLGKFGVFYLSGIMSGVTRYVDSGLRGDLPKIFHKIFMANLFMAKIIAKKKNPYQHLALAGIYLVSRHFFIYMKLY